MDTREAEKLIESSDEFRLLRRIPSVERWRLPSPSGELRRAIILDTETTGLDTEKDEVIELALLPVRYDRQTGHIVAIDIERAFSSLRQPSSPISASSTFVHGITNQDVQGCAISEKDVREIVDDAQLIIAHNAAFDRPMVEKHWAIFEEKSWACSLNDIAWDAERFGSRKLDYLLMRQGWFFEAHRALSDAVAAAFLLTLDLPVSNSVAMASLLKNARRPLLAVRAEETAFEQRAALKQRGYRWDSGGAGRAKGWWVLTDDPATEVAWLRREVYQDERPVPVIDVPATRRYSSRIWRS